ncbi:copper chaperone PCu(A)C [Sinorhizobium sp. BG8]|uniref:copper chaperone PCu(A)C n=1 Tax=Sinorhizobium sp. BG8 TaxID=2613773 RepID=UPI00193E369B|nr:copper chaperone PCu(A)C [Sinorhizobium sp. BG8]QRM54644.1 copper chaperone PCu(A)C [Sinorhizobium sp. BG8]
MKRVLMLLAALVISATASFAHEFKLGDLEIHHPASKATLPGQPVGGGFMTIINHGSAPDRLVAITSDVSDDVQIHEMSVVDGVMKMRQLAEGVEIAPGATVELKPGGLHVMFMSIKQPFVEGEMIKAKLTFAKAGSIDVEFKVEAARKGAATGEGKADEPHVEHKM